MAAAPMIDADDRQHPHRPAAASIWTTVKPAPPSTATAPTPRRPRDVGQAAADDDADEPGRVREDGEQADAAAENPRSSRRNSFRSCEAGALNRLSEQRRRGQQPEAAAVAGHGHVDVGHHEAPALRQLAADARQHAAGRAAGQRRSPATPCSPRSADRAARSRHTPTPRAPAMPSMLIAVGRGSRPASPRPRRRRAAPAGRHERCARRLADAPSADEVRVRARRGRDSDAPDAGAQEQHGAAGPAGPPAR